MAGAAAALTAFLCYHATLLPGLDLGDSASFQTGIGSLTLTPRQAYPLYYGLGNVFALLHGGEPAYAMNLASALYAALAVGIAILLAAELSGSTLGGVVAGLFLAFSYTFWSQAITAEVYALHLLIVGAALLALLEWSNKPTLSRLALFYAIYALGFGNHLGMILLLPGLALFILLHRKSGRADPLQPKAVGLAVAIAALASLQYAWNFLGLWSQAEPPGSVSDAFAKFWFDVTKSDWRETLVMGISETGLQSRPAMFWFDLRQQFGVPGILLAAVGFVYVVARWPRRGFLLLTIYLTTLAFAWTYNVGDAYIFFLPTHYVLALCIAPGVAAIMALCRFASPLFPLPLPLAPLLGTLCLLYPVWRGYDAFPALDRSSDNRAVRVLDQLTAQPYSSSRWFCPDAIFGLDANWQVQNAAEYYMRAHRPGVPWFTADELDWLTPHNPLAFQRFVDLLRRSHRHVVVTPETLRKLRVVNPGASLPLREDPQRQLVDEIASLPDGMPYALGVLRQYPEFPIDGVEFEQAWRTLTGNAELPQIGDYTIIIGRVGHQPELVKTSARPFRVRASLSKLAFDVRMESWLPTDTIRRSGFGHVIVNRTHMLTLERGVSFLAMGEAGPPVLTEYRAGLFAPTQRFVFGVSDLQPAPCYR